MIKKDTEMIRCEIESNGTDLFVVFGGVRIAKRGQPDTSQAGSWIALEPGFAVYSNGSEITIEQNGVRIQ